MTRRCACLVMMVSCVIALVSTDAAFGETVYVAAKTAQLSSGKTSLDPVVASLKLGDTLDVVTREDHWLQVQTSLGFKGWIYYNNVSTSKPSGGDSGLAAMGRSFRGTDASNVTASAGARGLDKASEGYANRSGITQQQRDAVDHMTAYKIPDEEIQGFLKTGKLGEYGE